MIFTGEENEKEFLAKCVEQWELTAESDIPEMIKVMRLATVFTEMRNRIDALGREESKK
ncbi:hypothetical protein RV17_GL000266 [Enterococcus thailandicus]|nr:hypothetical protein RV17_GL000266 [Enterococcus thailandicus]